MMEHNRYPWITGSGHSFIWTTRRFLPNASRDATRLVQCPGVTRDQIKCFVVERMFFFLCRMPWRVATTLCRRTSAKHSNYSPSWANKRTRRWRSERVRFWSPPTNRPTSYVTIRWGWFAVVTWEFTVFAACARSRSNRSFTRCLILLLSFFPPSFPAGTEPGFAEP